MNRTCKRMLTLLLVVSMLLGMSVTASAADTATSVSLDGQVIETNAYGDKNGRTQIPVQTILKLGLSYKQDGNKITYSNGTDEISLAVGDAAGDTTAVEGYAPLRFIAEYFGYEVNWNGAQREVQLVSPSLILKPANDMIVLSTTPDGSDLTEKEYKIWSNPQENHSTGFFTLTNKQSSKIGSLTATVYIPEGSEQGNQAIMILPESGVENYEEFITSSGWKAVADKTKCYVIALNNPNADNVWRDYTLEEANITDFIAGVSGASAYFLVMSHCMYLVGYGDAATLAQKYAMQYPTKVSGLATFGDLDIASDYMAQAGNTQYKVSGNNNDINNTVNKDIPMNVWMSISGKDKGTNAAVIDYWTAANATAKDSIDNELVAEVKTATNGTAQNAADALLCVQRYIGYTLSNMRAYSKAEDLGADVCYTPVDVSTGDKPQYMNVQYYVYVPKALDANTEGKAPVVLIFHGGTGNGDEFLSRSGWWKIADEQGCIVVSLSKMYAPKESNGNYANAENEMVNGVLTQVLKNYPADASRVYAYGFSGGGQMTWQLATSQYAEKFAAIISRSGMPKSNQVQVDRLMDDTSDVYKSPLTEYVVPIWLVAGQYESEYYDTVEKFNRYGDYFRMRNGVSNVEATTEYFNYVGDFAYTTAKTYYNDQNVPMFRTSITADIGHSIACSEARTAYVDFAKHFSRNIDTGALYYDGKLVTGK